METVRIAAYVVAVPAVLFSMYCAVAATVSWIEDKTVDSEDMASTLRTTDFLTDLRKAA